MSAVYDWNRKGRGSGELRGKEEGEEEGEEEELAVTRASLVANMRASRPPIFI